MNTAVVFDAWKLPIFQRHLEQSGLPHDPLTGIPSGTLGFCVHSDDAKAVEKIVRSANAANHLCENALALTKIEEAQRVVGCESSTGETP